MDDPKSRDEKLNKLVEAWHAYGAQFSVFVPQQQPAPTTWESEVEEFDDKGRSNPQHVSTVRENNLLVKDGIRDN